jgi:Glycosyl-4,4'-diaponeurosporenoate acyltransferase
VWLVVIDVVLVVAISIGVGAWAPRWRDSWVGHDAFPLTRLPWEKPTFFRRIGVARLSRRLPEMGATFGGESKSALPGRTAAELQGYLREVRRAEWVHWVSIASTLLLFAFNPWWLALAFVVVVTLGNLPFILVLRNNRFRLQRILDKDGGR